MGSCLLFIIVIIVFDSKSKLLKIEFTAITREFGLNDLKCKTFPLKSNYRTEFHLFSSNYAKLKSSCHILSRFGIEAIQIICDTLALFSLTPLPQEMSETFYLGLLGFIL